MPGTGQQEKFPVRGHNGIKKPSRAGRYKIGGSFDDDHRHFELRREQQKIIVQHRPQHLFLGRLCVHEDQARSRRPAHRKDNGSRARWFSAKPYRTIGSWGWGTA